MWQTGEHLESQMQSSSLKLFKIKKNCKADLSSELIYWIEQTCLLGMLRTSRNCLQNSGWRPGVSIINECFKYLSRDQCGLSGSIMQINFGVLYTCSFITDPSRERGQPGLLASVGTTGLVQSEQFSVQLIKKFTFALNSQL